jgi:hypothetical protein
MILTKFSASPRLRFIDDNFGSFLASFGYSLYPDAFPHFVKPIKVATERRESESDVLGPQDLLLHMADNEKSFDLAQLAAIFTPRVAFHSETRRSLSLVIGDTAADRLMHWLAFGLYRNIPGFYTFVLSPAYVEDREFLTAFVHFLNTRAAVVPYGGVPHISVRSASLNEERLTPIWEKIRTVNTEATQFLRPGKLEDMIPNDSALREVEEKREWDWHELAVQEVAWTEVSSSQGVLRVPPLRPAQLRDVRDGSGLELGVWALDLDIERRDTLPSRTARQYWHFPRRLRIHGAFISPYEVFRRGWYPRASREGHLVLFADLEGELPPVKLCDDETAFSYALERGRDWPDFPYSANRTRGGPYAAIRPSDIGRYLIGALRLLGGLQTAEAFLLHKYWREIFEQLGGVIGDFRHESVKAILKRRLSTDSTFSMRDGDWDRLTKLVLSEARAVRMPRVSLSYGELRRRHEILVDELRRKNEISILEKDEAAETIAARISMLGDQIARERASLAKSVESLCVRGILHQGYERWCKTCYYMNWFEITAVRPTLTCAVCGTQQSAPANEPWRFQLNGFLREGLKEHGLLAVVWCLGRLSKRAKKSFFYLGPHQMLTNLASTERLTAEREVDLLCVIDGVVHLCEVKSSSRRFSLAPIVEVAKRIRPDVVTLAIMEEEPASAADRGQELKQALNGLGIESGLLWLQDQDLKGDATLPELP